jgi:hypothetical protein
MGDVGLAIISCPGCGRDGLRIPDGRRGKVTCPTCGAEWFYPESVEINEVEFRCAHSGARFIVQLARRSPLHKFVIHGIKDAPAPSRSSGEVGSTSVSTEADSEKAMIPNQRSDAPRPSRPAVLLSRLFGKAVQAASPTQHSEDGVTKADSKAKLYPTRHDASDYNWSSFFCPYCNATSFIRCHGGHFACDGTVQIRSGRRFHQCFCRGAGFIEGAIKSFEVKETTLSLDPVSPKPRKTDTIVPEEPSNNALTSPSKDKNKRLLP